MARDKQALIAAINDSILLFSEGVIDGSIDPEDITEYIHNNMPEAVQSFLYDNSKRLINDAVKACMRNASGADYDSKAPQQMVLGLEIPVFLTFRNDTGKATYMLTMNARQEHFLLAAAERLKQSDYDAKKAATYTEIANMLSETPEIPLGIALQKIQALKAA